METPAKINGRAWLVYGGLAAAGLAVAGGALVVLVATFSYLQAVDYPRGDKLADQTVTHWYPALNVRRDATYRTNDPFPKVYNYYSVGFDLGPEAFAQSHCILMARSRTAWRVLRAEMSVTVCETPDGQMMFVMRSLALRWP